MAIQVYFDGVLIKQLGAYVKTDLSAVRQINGVGTGVVAAVGLAEGGEENKAYRIFSHAEAVTTFRGGPLVEHMRTMFLGGAGEVVGVRIGNPLASSLDLELDDGDSATFDLGFTSIEKSTLANNILVQLDIDEGASVGSTNDDTFILTVMQKYPDCSVVKEIYEFPREFNRYTVLVRRENRLFFVQNWMVEQAIAAIPLEVEDGITPGNMIPNPDYDTDAQAAILAVLQDSLLASDFVEIFAPADEVPLGLMVYEINEGGLFGYERSRIVRATVDGEAAEYTVDRVTLFGAAPTPFFDVSTNAFVSTDITTKTFTVDTILANNADFVSNFYALSGGYNGNDGTSLFGNGTGAGFGLPTVENATWTAGLQALENEEVNFVQPAYRFHFSTSLSDRVDLFTNVSLLVLAHVKQMSAVHMRRRRTTVLGFPAPTTASYAKATYLETALSVLTSLTSDTDRAQTWVSPFTSTAADGVSRLLGGEYFASYMAGRHSNREPQISITFTPTGGLGAEYLYDWTYAEKDRLISQRVAFVEKIKNTFGAVFYRVHHNPTSWLGPVTGGYQEFILRRIDDFVSTYLFKNVEDTFIGRPSYGRQTSAEIKRYIESLLSSLVGRQLVAFRDVVVTPNEDKTVYNVTFYAQPVTEIKFILITMNVRFDLE